MNIRRLNEIGISRFTEFIDSLSGETPLPFPSSLLTDPEATENVSPPIHVEQIKFGSRFDGAKYLYNLFKDSALTDIHRDRGLWAWLSLFFFDQLCPSDTKGHRKPGERARWIPESGVSWRYYRHLLAGPYSIYRGYNEIPELALAVLCGPLHQPGDIVEQLASRQELVTNKAIMETSTFLYVDKKTMKTKRGAAGRGPGSARRLADIFNQFDVTWDLYSMNLNDCLEMLPAEFDRFKSKSV